MISTFANIASILTSYFYMATSPVVIQPTECGSQDEVKYCFYQGDPSSKRVVYFFHGFGNNSEAWGWNNVTRKIEAQWNQEKITRPHVVSLSFGNLWWYSQKKQGELFRDFALGLETKKNIQSPDRVLFGDSMGGHNALRWSHDFPEFFNKLAVVCPALPLSYVQTATGFKGYWPFNDLADSLITSQGSSNLLKEENFLKRYEKMKGIFIAVSTEDHFGFYSGGKELYYSIQSINPNVNLEEQAVFHCRVNPKVLSSFLIN